jgi:hypothetical protein
MKIKSYFLIGLLLTIFACSTVPKSSQLREKQLLKQLSQWKNLRIDGVAELNYKGFSLRKNIVIKKNNAAIRADLFDSGIFGMSPTPFISVYFSDELWAQLPGQKKAEQLTTVDAEKLSMISEIIFNIDKLYEQKKEIISTKKAVFENVIISFNDNLQIAKIELIEKKYHAVFSYNEVLSDISFWQDDKKAADIQIDKISFTEQEVNKINISEKL